MQSVYDVAEGTVTLIDHAFQMFSFNTFFHLKKITLVLELKIKINWLKSGISV